VLAFAAGIVLTIIPATLLHRPDPQMEKTLAEANAAVARMQQQVAQLSAPHVNASLDVYPLNVVRGDTSATPIALAPTPRTIVLMLDQEADPAYTSYRAQLTDSTGKPAWSEDHLEPGARSLFAISIPSQMLHPGDYTLAFEGTAGGKTVPLAKYALRAQ
jgi:hypothetical protein